MQCSAYFRNTFITDLFTYLVALYRKSHKFTHPPASSKNSPVVCISSQKHPGVHKENKLNFNEHIKERIAKASEAISLIINSK